MNKHTTARIGKRIHVILHSGVSFIEKLKERRSKYYVFENIGKVFVSDIKSFSIARQRGAQLN